MRADLSTGDVVVGPALIIESHQTIVVEPGWQGEITERNHVLMRRVAKKRRMAALGTEADPVNADRDETSDEMNDGA